MMSPSKSPTSIIQSDSGFPREANQKLRCIVVTSTLIACLGPLCFGFVLGYPSPIEPEVKGAFHWNNESFSWFTAMPPLGALVGSNFGSYGIERFGRKLAIMLCSLPLVAGWAMIAASKTTAVIFIGRFLTGLGIGPVSLAVPVYIAEITPAKYRGALGCGNQLAVTFGFLIVYTLGAFINGNQNWRWLALAGAVFPTVLMLMMTCVPETPRWLVKKGHISEALTVLRQLRGGTLEENEEECQDIRNTLGGSGEAMSYSDLRKPGIYKPLALSVFLMIFQQFSGINIVMTYGSQILAEAGYSNSKVVAIVLAAVQFVATAISCVIVDKLGRRILLIIPGIVMSVCMTLLGVYFYHKFYTAVAVVLLSLFITGFSLGWGPLPWLVMSEIFPTRVRGLAAGISTMVNWIGVFIVVKTFTQLEHSFQPYGAYWFYAVICFISAIYVFFCLPETKGKTLEEIEELFDPLPGLQSPLISHAE